MNVQGIFDKNIKRLPDSGSGTEKKASFVANHKKLGSEFYSLMCNQRL